MRSVRCRLFVASLRALHSRLPSQKQRPAYSAIPAYKRMCIVIAIAGEVCRFDKDNENTQTTSKQRERKKRTRGPDAFVVSGR